MSNEKEDFKRGLWQKIRASRSLVGSELHCSQDVFSECFDEMQKKLEEKDERIDSLQNELSRITKKYSECINKNTELKIQLEGEREAVNTISRFLNEEKLRAGKLEKQNAELRDILDNIATDGCLDFQPNEEHERLRLMAKRTLAKFKDE